MAALAADKSETCPAPVICQQIDHEFTQAKAENNKARERFVGLLAKGIPKYDCKRSYDTHPVPALWLCDGTPGIDSTRVEDWFDLLSKLKTPAARRLYGSSKFRSVLDGATAEAFFDDSLKVEREQKNRKK